MFKERRRSFVRCGAFGEAREKRMAASPRLVLVSDAEVRRGDAVVESSHRGILVLAVGGSLHSSTARRTARDHGGGAGPTLGGRPARAGRSGGRGRDAGEGSRHLDCYCAKKKCGAGGNETRRRLFGERTTVCESVNIVFHFSHPDFCRSGGDGTTSRVYDSRMPPFRERRRCQILHDPLLSSSFLFFRPLDFSPCPLSRRIILKAIQARRIGVRAKTLASVGRREER